MYLDFLSVFVDSEFDMGGDSIRIRECLGELVPVDLVSPVGRHVRQEMGVNVLKKGVWGCHSALCTTKVQQQQC